MNSPWTHHEPTMDHHGLSVGCSWDAHGPAMDPRWAVQGLPMDSWTVNEPAMDPRWTHDVPTKDHHEPP